MAVREWKACSVGWHMALNREEMREYQRARRAKFAALKENPALKVVKLEPRGITEPRQEPVPVGGCPYGCERMLEDFMADVRGRQEQSPDRLTRDGLSAFSGHIADLRERVETIEHVVEELQVRVGEVERELSLEELSRKASPEAGGAAK
jgi:hypothetical protein